MMMYWSGKKMYGEGRREMEVGAGGEGKQCVAYDMVGLMGQAA